MPLFKFRVAWTDDDSIQRDIEVLSSQSFHQLHQSIVAAFALKPEWQANFAVLNEVGKRTHVLNTEVEKNLRDAPALSCKRTPVGALVTHPSQEFMYSVENPQEWDFTLNLITIEKDAKYVDESLFPRVVRTEGVHPHELSSGQTKANVSETEERYDPNEATDGYGDEGEDDNDGFDGGFGDDGGDYGADQNDY